jgi:hypothetical protein
MRSTLYACKLRRVESRFRPARVISNYAVNLAWGSSLSVSTPAPVVRPFRDKGGCRFGQSVGGASPHRLRHGPGLPARGATNGCVCCFHQGKPHEVRQRQRTRQEIRVYARANLRHPSYFRWVCARPAVKGMETLLQEGSLTDRAVLTARSWAYNNYGLRVLVVEGTRSTSTC